jgi:hypothetical protein
MAHVVILCALGPPKEVCSTAGFQIHQMKHWFAQINAQRVDFHEMRLCPALNNIPRAAADYHIAWPDMPRK